MGDVRDRNGGKVDRRAAILASAARLVGDGEFSMRQLAETARVSPATPYNLFGTKRGVIAALFAERCAHFIQRLDDRGEHESIRRLFAAIDLFADELEAEPDALRAIFAILYRRADEVRLAADDPAVDMWRGLIERAWRDDRLRPPADRVLLARGFVHLIVGATLDWVDGALDAQACRISLHHNVALLMLGIAAPELRDWLTHRISASPNSPP